MIVPFDKIYVISYIRNVNKQNKMKKYLNNIWNVDFDFIYGIDTNNLKYIFDFPKIHLMTENNKELYNIGHISGTLAHYTAIQHALLNKFNSCLVIEDDAIFTDDLEYIQYCFDNIPKDANCCRFGLTWRDNDRVKNFDGFWVKNEICWGTQCYSINNKKAMEYYLNQIQNEFTTCDEPFLFMKNTYSLNRIICKDTVAKNILVNFLK